MDQPDAFTGKDAGDIEVAGGPGCGVFGRDRADILQQLDLAPDPAARVIVDQGAAVKRRWPDIVAREIEDDAANAATTGRGADPLLGFVGAVAFLAGIKA